MNAQQLLEILPMWPKKRIVNGLPKGWHSSMRKLEKDGLIRVERRGYIHRAGYTEYQAGRVDHEVEQQ